MSNIKKILSMILALSLVLSAAQMPHVYATPIFGTPLDLNGSSFSSVPHIAASGSKVYAVWSDGSDIWSTFSANNGTTTSVTNVSDSGGTATTPKIAIGTSAYVVWGDSADNKIYFEKNTTGNNVFDNTPTELISTGTNSEPRIAASGDNVYVVWKDSTGKISYRASSNGATSFAAKVDLSSTGTEPQIAASGSTAYIVWRDTSSGSSGGIRLAVVSSAGGAASATASLSSNAVSSTPQIAASGTTAYVVWADSTPSGSNGDILFSTVSNTGVISVNGANISSNTGTSAKPQVAVDASDVYVTWQDTITSSSTNDEILFKHSTDSGANFGSQVNLSNTSTSSTLPSIAVSGSNVNVVWRDDVLSTSTTSRPTILFKSSTDKGVTFGGLKDLSASQTSSTVPQVVASGTRAYAVWTSTVSSTTHAFLISGTTKDNCSKTIDQFDSVINGTESSNVIIGTSGADLINGLGGDDRIWGKGGDDCILGGEGNDYLVGGAGNDEIDGENGNDRIWGQSGIDVLHGWFGIDRLVGGIDDDILFGDQDNDFLWGQAGNDTLDGGTETDVCSGGIGTNIITSCE